MKVHNITITLGDNKDKKFTLEQNDWEGAPDPICMSMITEESWGKVTVIHIKKFVIVLEKSLNEYYSPDIDEDLLDEVFWSEYERLVLKHCKCFYYEDMSGEEYDAYKSADDADECAILEKAYARIKG